MGAAMAPAESMVYTSFMKWVHNQEEHIRLENYHDYNEYYYGNHTVKLPDKIKFTLEQDLAVIVNYCKPVVDITVQFLCGDKIGIDVTEFAYKSDDSLYAEQLLYGVYRANNLLYQNMLKLLRINGKKGDVFLKLYVRDGFIRVAVIRPDMVFPKYHDDDYELMQFCVTKSFVLDEDGRRFWQAQVFYPDHVDFYNLGVKSGDDGTDRGGKRWFRYSVSDKWKNQWSEYSEYSDTHTFDTWDFQGTMPNPLGMIPIIHIKNNTDDLPFGVSDLQAITPLQDVLNKAATDLSVVMDTQAFQRLFILGSMGDDEIEVGPGTIMQLPEGESVQVVPPGNIGNMILDVQNTLQHIAAISSIPVEAFRGFSGVPASGYALRILFMRLEARCNETMASVTNALANLNRMILMTASLMGYASWQQFQNLESEIHFTTGIPIDKLADTQYYGMHLNMRTMSRQYVMEQAGVENTEEMKAQIQQELLEDYGLAQRINEATGGAEQEE